MKGNPGLRGERGRDGQPGPQGLRGKYTIMSTMTSTRVLDNN